MDTDISIAEKYSEKKGVFQEHQISPVEPEQELVPHALEVETFDTEDESVVNGGGSSTTEHEDEICTYQVEPTVKVESRELTQIAEEALRDFLANKEYSEVDMKDYSKKISISIRNMVKRMGFDRYRIVCQVTIGEKTNQDVIMAFLCLWKHEFDHYAVANYESDTFFASALVFVIYKQ